MNEESGLPFVGRGTEHEARRDWSTPSKVFVRKLSTVDGNDCRLKTMYLKSNDPFDSLSVGEEHLLLSNDQSSDQWADCILQIFHVSHVMDISGDFDSLKHFASIASI